MDGWSVIYHNYANFLLQIQVASLCFGRWRKAEAIHKAKRKSKIDPQKATSAKDDVYRIWKLKFPRKPRTSLSSESVVNQPKAELFGFTPRRERIRVGGVFETSRLQGQVWNTGERLGKAEAVRLRNQVSAALGPSVLLVVAFFIGSHLAF